MPTKPNAAGLAERPSLAFKRHLHAPPEKVYAAWTDPQKIVKWFGRADARPDSFQAEIDARVGGRYRVSFSTDSEYHEVDAGARIAGHGSAEPRWRRHPADADPRAAIRSGRA
jgi:uncharacterized protein YndB with AHSA1/START domain